MSDAREWSMDMSAAPENSVIEVVGRLPQATAGFPQYAMWWESMNAFCQITCSLPLQPLVCWAWRERTDWPDEPRS